MRLYALHCGGDVADMALFDPFDEGVGTKLYNPHFIYVITHPRGAVLFDTGAHPALRDDPESRLGEAAAGVHVRLSPEDRLDVRLATVGLTVDDIDLVVVSHLHWDHAGGLEWLRHAPVLVQRAELEFAYDPPVYQRDVYVRADFDHGLNWRELDGDHDVYGDGSIVALHTPGHTPGHQSLMVRLDGGVVLLLADAAYLLAKMRARRLPGLLWSPDATIASWDRLEALEREHRAFAMTTHDLDFRERVKLAPDAWYE
jgi:N-acyl homoserine lactone hydrolase